MATTDFTISDITSAVASTTATVLGGPERKCLVAATYAAHKGGMGVGPAFKASWPGPPAPKLTPKIEKDFDTAVQAAKAKRLAKRRTGGSSGTSSSDPEAEKKAALGKAETDARAERNAVKQLADDALKSAENAEADADAANEAATEAEKLRAGSTEATAARTASDEARKAADAARAASNEATTQFNGADGALLLVEGIVTRKGDVADTEAHLEAIRGARRAAVRHSETAGDRETDASKARKRAETQRDKLKPPITDPPKEKNWKKWLSERGLVFGALIVALAMMLIAAAIGLPAWVPPAGLMVTLYLIAVPAVAIWASVQEPPAGRSPAGILTIIAVAAFVIAFQGGDGKSTTKDEPASTEPTPTIVADFGVEGGFTPAPTFTPAATPGTTPTATSTP